MQQNKANTSQKKRAFTDYATLGNRAYQSGDILKALECYAQCVSAEPSNHSYKVRLAHLLKDVQFKSFNPKFKTLILRCLQTQGIDYQNLAMPWFSLFMNDKNYAPLHRLMDGTSAHEDKKVLSCLKDHFFVQGVANLTVYDVRFENMLRGLLTDFAQKHTLPKAFQEALDAYCERTENIFSDDPLSATPYPIDTSIPTLTLTQDNVSQNVREHYEEHPYPRWTSINVQAASKADEARTHKHLIAGCGTGNGACATALKYPNAQITAIDLSLASLSYAKKKAQELKLNNISFSQGDILDLSSLEERYDIIECSGVLHHMDDPTEGWRCLLGKIAQGGKMHIGLYSEYGRADVVAAKALVQERQYEPTHSGIRAAREEIIALPEEHPAKPVMERRDFYSTSSCRDLIFHEHEHRYTLLQLQNTLDELGLVFDGFDLHSPRTAQRYISQHPDDPKMLNLTNWHKFEKNNPDIFRGMYQFWCYPK